MTLPFVVRTVQPVLADIPKEVEEAARLGARPLQVFRHILVPALLPAWLTGFPWPSPGASANTAR